MKLVVAILGGLLIFVASSNEASACRCGAKGPFLTNAAEAAIVIRATIATNAYASRRNGWAIEMIVDEVVKGDAALGHAKLTGSRVCPPYPRELAPGTSWIIALERLHPNDGHFVRSCGLYWIRVRGSRVEGEIIQDSGESMSLAELRARIKQRQKP